MNKIIITKTHRLSLLLMFCLSSMNGVSGELNEVIDTIQNSISYHNDVKPILEKRCVACHACYDSPCQLKLGSIAGIERGATRQLVYDGGRLDAVKPTRLFIDAVNTRQWREKEFYSILDESSISQSAVSQTSLLAKMLQLKRVNPQPEFGKLSDSLNLDLNRELECSNSNDFDEYKKKHPNWGMPYAMPGLSEKQEKTILSWLQEGAEFDEKPQISAQAEENIARWEHFFNRQSLKQQLVSRYIYEHLFIGHLYFKGDPDNNFFYLVRSTTPPGKPINEIATRLPYNEPGVTQFYYRLRLIESTIVDKTHFVYELGKDRMARYEELFFQPYYKVTQLPSYQPEVAANPFLAFAEIPYDTRYHFLLDDTQYFVSGFIKGPICRGQVALSVIRDRFWVAFLSPDANKNQLQKSKHFHDFLTSQVMLLSLPGTAGQNLGLFGFEKYDDFAEQYLKNKEIFANQQIKNDGAYQISDLWDGNGSNKNATLTIFRHIDSATVVTGLIGEVPLTVMVVDYPLLERIHYSLVAGFDIYSSVNHQLAARKYMDYLRMDGENNFLRFMPDDQRKKMHDSWYKGLSGKLATYLDTPHYSAGYETGVDYKTTDYKKEFFSQLKQRLGNAAGVDDVINQCEKERCQRNNATKLQQEIDAYMRQLVQLKGEELSALPEISLLRIKTGNGETDLVYTLLINKALENVSFILGAEYRREPELDSLTIVPGFLGSYPNFFFEVEKDQLAAFISAVKDAKNEKKQPVLYETFGIRRTNPKIWESVDWFNARHKEYRGIRAGLFDMSRYHNL